jgi:hypothetical protein
MKETEQGAAMFNGENNGCLLLGTLYTADLARLSLLLPLATCITMFINCLQSNSTTEQLCHILSFCSPYTLYSMLCSISDSTVMGAKNFSYKNSLNVKNMLLHYLEKQDDASDAILNGCIEWPARASRVSQQNRDILIVWLSVRLLTHPYTHFHYSYRFLTYHYESLSICHRKLEWIIVDDDGQHIVHRISWLHVHLYIEQTILTFRSTDSWITGLVVQFHRLILLHFTIMSLNNSFPFRYL